MNEAETRAEHIDPALRAAGWGVVEGSRVLREHGITAGRLQGAGQRARAEVADYVLVYRNTQLAVVEAKAWDKPCAEGVAQAKSYAQKLRLRYHNALTDAATDLGPPDQIRKIFLGFQRLLYQGDKAA